MGALELLSVHLGSTLGLYDALLAGDGLTPPELADRAGIGARYAREWLEQQAVAGLVTVDDAAAAEDDRRYRLPAAHAAVLADPESLAYVAPFGALLAGVGEALPKLVDAYRTGGGVPYAD